MNAMTEIAEARAGALSLRHPQGHVRPNKARGELAHLHNGRIFSSSATYLARCSVRVISARLKIPCEGLRCDNYRNEFLWR